MKREIHPLQLGFDIGATIAQTSHWRDTNIFHQKAKEIVAALGVIPDVADDPLFYFGLGQGCGHRHNFPIDKEVKGVIGKFK